MSDGLLGRLLEPAPLTDSEVASLFSELTNPQTPEVVRAGLLVALESRGAPVAELAAFARAMRRAAVPFDPPGASDAVDVCGTGGAATPSFNVSTVTAFVVAGAGQRVIKHGNRSARSPTGSSDLLEALGLGVALSQVEFARRSFKEYGLAFLHAPLFHPATRAVSGVRRVLGIPTVFNRLGPLTNPAGVRYQVTGAASVEDARRSAEALLALGGRRGLSVVSEDGADEFSPSRLSHAFVWGSGRLRPTQVDPGKYLEGDDRRGPWGPLPPPAAAEETIRLLSGGGGARRGAVLLTSGAALWVGGAASSLRSGVTEAAEALDDGRALSLLEDLRTLAAEIPSNGGG
ncbi:MAG TPA: anthranilate phosphoribosyltransferase [Thermoplasmata archaeon]|nr:anthranilate phosphoribosyltransferase [Thermoplasmata archaeon]